ncbi:heparin lyase I family protein [Flavobacterium sp. KACC 22763]|uniref:heparin lyase I family protein n=1 Tax=Flavobacterium sp. KACC 22763 TaxID=3025668 RepID=UPI002365D375|nr:heparin lyase I family protein [Flavobacterium sp. KACC 22763]WDF65443.1 heparin lyase I family protein [Flavobacterium sp. KACC 22763]
MKKSLLVLLCVFSLLEIKAQNSNWEYNFGITSSMPYASTAYSSTYLPSPTAGGGTASVRASSTTEGFVELTSSNLAGGSGAELKMNGGTTVSGAKFGLGPFTATAVAAFECKINITSGTNGRFLIYFGNGSNFTNGSGISLPQTFAALRLSPTPTAISLDWLSSTTSPNYTTAGLSQVTINKSQVYVLKFFMNNSNAETSYTTGSASNLTTHNLAAGTFDIWIDNIKVLTNADPGTGFLPQGSNINSMNLLNVGAGSSAPVLYIDDIVYSNSLIATPPTPPATITDTLVTVDYESGTENSGISNLTTTHATATDAEYLVSPGRTGNYAIAHRVTIGDSGYFSDNHWRSEAATAQMPTDGKYYPGDERRFEVSLLLKDWESHTPGMAQNGDIIFQGKQSGGENPAWYLSAKRNSITFRIPNDNIEPSIIDDFRPYINQWIDFRIDAKMTTDNTGYYKVYYRLPGQNDYTLAWQVSNFKTFNQDVPETNPSGYLKWGLYRPGQSITSDPPNVMTRIIYHDDIKIFELNNNSAPTQIWGNTFTGNNVEFIAPITAGNTTNPNIISDGNTAPNFYYGTSGGLNTAGVISGRVLLNGWTSKTNTSDPATSFNPDQYFEFKLQPKNGYKINFSNLKFTARKGNTADPSTFVIRSSVDNFTSDITASQTFTGTAATLLTYDLSPLTNIKTPITLRLYWYGSNRTSGTSLVGIDDFSFNGQVKTVLYLPEMSNIITNTNTGLPTYTAQANEFDITALNNCSNVAYSYLLTGATSATGNTTLANKVFNKGITTVTWTAADGCNNSSTSFTITINDTEKPVFAIPAPITLSNDENQCGATFILTQPIVTDNCAVASIINNAPTVFPHGTTTVIWTATDENGNTATTSQTVTVTDAQKPTVNSVTSVVLCYESSGNYNIPSATATDNCTIDTATYAITGATTRNGNGLDASGNFNVGTSVITWTVTDNAGNNSTNTSTVTINNPIAALIPDVYAVNPGGDANTIYLGYGPTSLTLNATPTSGTAPFTYLWSTGATTDAISINLSTLGVHDYSVTITDAKGCYINITKQIKVIDINCNPQKVIVCHTNNKNLCIPANAVPAHLAHGCHLGSCENASLSTNAETKISEQQIDDFIVIASPNPTKTEFQINIAGGDEKQAIYVNVFDMLGRKIETVKSNYTSSIIIKSNFSAGTYLAEVSNGTNRKTIKLIKQ